MSKKALCIRKQDLPKDYLECLKAGASSLVEVDSNEFFACRTVLMDRSVCETDENYLQIIPYVVLEKDFSVFRYSRGKGGAEARLHANLSVGIGGHIEEEPGIRGLHALILQEAAREIEEETGLVLAEGDLDVDLLSNKEVLLICDPSNEVGRVHLGIVIVAPLPEDTWISPEKFVIEDGDFVDMSKLNDTVAYECLENWSKLVVTNLY